MSSRYVHVLSLMVCITGCGAAAESDPEADEEEVDTAEEAVPPVCWTNAKESFFGCTSHRMTCVGQYETTVNYKYVGNCW